MISNDVRTIHLHGRLAQFGESFDIAVGTPKLALRFLASQLPGFVDAMKEGDYFLVRGDDPENGLSYDLDSIDFSIGPPNSHFHIIPAVAGAKQGVGKAIAGAVLMVVAVVGAAFTAGSSLSLASVGAGMAGGVGGSAALAAVGITWKAVFTFGLALTLGGVASMLQPSAKPDLSKDENPDQRASFFLGGQVNQVAQGGPVVLGYGRCQVGSTIMSVGLTTERLYVYAPGFNTGSGGLPGTWTSPLG